MHGRIMKPFTWTMIFVLLFQWSGVAATVAAQREAEARQARAEEAVEKLERLFDALEEAAKEIPRDTFDPQSIVDKVGKDPMKLFEWVRDNTHIVPYRGTLRGPTGVLMDRLGNSLDRALLLQDLLHRAGHNTRLAKSTLQRERATEIINKATSSRPAARRPPSRPPSRAHITAAIEESATNLQADAGQLRAVLDTIFLEQQQLSENLLQRTIEQTSEILSILGQAGLSPPKPEDCETHTVYENHWWVQFQERGRWVDLDPSLPGFPSRSALALPEKTMQPKQIPPELFHTVTFRIIVERLEAGELWEDKVLEFSLRPSEFFGNPVSLWHVPPAWINEVGELDIDRVSRKSTLTENIDEWLPVLTIGSKNIVQRSFTNSGRLNSKEERQKDDKDAAQRMAQSVTTIFGGLVSDDSTTTTESTESSETTQLTAEWIEYVLTVPGQEPRIFRRAILDLLGPSARPTPPLRLEEPSRKEILDRNARLLFTQVHVLPLVSRLNAIFGVEKLAESILENRALIMAVAKQTDRMDKVRLLAEKGGRIENFPITLFAFAVARNSWLGNEHALFLDRINLVALQFSAAYDDSGDLNARKEIDIVFNELQAESDCGSGAFLSKLKQGVFEANAETFLIDHERPAISTSELFEKSITQGVDWVALSNGKRSQLGAVDLSADMLARVTEDLSLGYWVVIPRKPLGRGQVGMNGWWRINPHNGHAVAVLENHGNAGLTEYKKAVKEGMKMGIAAAGFVWQVYTIWHWAECWLKKNEELVGSCNPCKILLLYNASGAGLGGLDWLINNFVLGNPIKFPNLFKMLMKGAGLINTMLLLIDFKWCFDRFMDDPYKSG